MAENRVWGSKYLTQGPARWELNVTYDSVNGPACCEWHFLSRALPFQEGDRQSQDRDSCFRGHASVPYALRNTSSDSKKKKIATGARLRFDTYETVAPKTPVSPITDELELVTHHFPLFG